MSRTELVKVCVECEFINDSDMPCFNCGNHDTKLIDIIEVIT